MPKTKRIYGKKHLVIYFLVGFVIGVLLEWFLLGSTKKAEAIYTPSIRWKWGQWSHWSEWGECQVPENGEYCGEVEGTRVRSRTRTCQLQFSSGSNQCEPGRVDEDVQEQGCIVEYDPCEEPVYCEDEGALNYDEKGECEYPQEPEVPAEPETETLTEAGPPPAPVCEDLSGWAPTVTRVWREDNDTVGFEWTKPRDEADDYIVWFGLTKDNLTWNKLVEDSQSTTVDLQDYPNVHVWMAVQETDNGCVGPISTAVDP